MKINEVIYYCLDAVKAISDDSHVNEDHVLFLLSKYRAFLLQQYYNTKRNISPSNYQIIPINLQSVEDDNPRYMYKSVEILPHTIDIVKPNILLFNGYEEETIEYIPFSRIKSIGYDKWKDKFIYTALGFDDYLYASCKQSITEEDNYQLKLRAVFEDFIKAFDLIHNNNDYDIMEEDFPLEFTLIPDVIARVVKDILGTAWRPSDKTNDGDDSLSDIAAFVRQNMKKRYNNTIEGEEE